MAGPSPKDDKRVAQNDGKRRQPRNEKPRSEKPAGQPEPLDEESLEKVMRETPL